MTCPLWILTHRELTDGDKVVLMILDQLGWREGSRDGVVLATNEEIGARLGKSASTIKRLLQHIATIQPPLIELEKADQASRDSIRLVYDRLGNDHLTLQPLKDISIAKRKTGVGQICTTPVSYYPDPTPIVTDGKDKSGVGQIWTAPSAGQIWTTPVLAGTTGTETLPVVEDSRGVAHAIPIKNYLNTREDVLVAEEENETGVGQICTTPDEVSGIATEVSVGASFPSGPRTLPDLISWLPGYTTVETEIKRLTRQLPLWLIGFRKRFPDRSEEVFCDWVTDALIESTDADDPVKYAKKILKGWSDQGGRPGIEIPLPVPVQADPEPAQVVAKTAPYINGYQPRPTKADRNSQVAADCAVLFKTMFKPKEAADGPR